MKYIVMLCFLLLLGCGNNNGEHKSSPVYQKRTYLGLYVGYFPVYVNKGDGNRSQQMYALYTTVVSDGVYLDYIPQAAFLQDRCTLVQDWNDYGPVSSNAKVVFGNNSSSYSTSAYVPYNIFY